MITRHALMLSALALGLGLAADPASAQFAFDAFEVAAEFTPPPDNGTPAILELRAEFTPPPDDSLPPPDDDIELRMAPPDPFAPTWALRFPAGCFVDMGASSLHVMDWQACGATLALLQPDGTIMDLSRFITRLEAQLSPPPDDTRPWRLDLELETLGLPSEAQPPDPARSLTALFAGQSSGTAAPLDVSWVMGIEPEPF